MDFRNNLHIQNIASILRMIGERVEGNLICDIDPENYVIDRYLTKIKNLQALCLGKKRICEIGVNAAHSLLLMLLVNPTAEYTLFDLGYHRYTRPCVEYIKAQFPDTKIEITYGNSVETILKYIAENPTHLGTYDVCHLDGGHTADVFSCDYENMKQLIQKNGIVVFDDYDLPAIASFIDRMSSKGEIIEVHEEDTVKTRLHFIYKYAV